MVESYNCLCLDNGYIFQVEIYKNENNYDNKKFFKIDEKKVPLEYIKVGQLEELISYKGKFEHSDILNLWKVDVDESRLNPSSTEVDIKNLKGLLMKRQHNFTKYFNDDYKPTREDNINIVAVITTKTAVFESLERKRKTGKVEDKSDVRVKKDVSKDEKDEIIPINNTTKLSYRDILVKGRVNKNENMENLSRRKLEREEEIMFDLIRKGIELLPRSESPINRYDFENENYDDLPDTPEWAQGKLSETERDKIMWKATCKMYEGTEAGEYFNKAVEIMEKNW